MDEFPLALVVPGLLAALIPGIYAGNKGWPSLALLWTLVCVASAYLGYFWLGRYGALAGPLLSAVIGVVNVYTLEKAGFLKRKPKLEPGEEEEFDED